MEKYFTSTAAYKQQNGFNVRNFVNTINTPIRWLANYYADILGHDVSPQLTRSLLEAQIAFFVGIMPAPLPLFARAIALVWFLVAAKRSKKQGL